MRAQPRTPTGTREELGFGEPRRPSRPASEGSRQERQSRCPSVGRPPAPGAALPPASAPPPARPSPAICAPRPREKPAWELESRPGHLRRFATPRRLPGQGQQHPLEQLVGLLVVLGDVGVLVQAKHLRVGRDGEAPEVLDVRLEGKPSAGPRGSLAARPRRQGLARPGPGRHHTGSEHGTHTQTRAYHTHTRTQSQIHQTRTHTLTSTHAHTRTHTYIHTGALTLGEHIPSPPGFRRKSQTELGLDSAPTHSDCVTLSPTPVS